MIYVRSFVTLFNARGWNGWPIQMAEHNMKFTFGTTIKAMIKTANKLSLGYGAFLEGLSASSFLSIKYWDRTNSSWIVFAALVFFSIFQFFNFLGLRAGALENFTPEKESEGRKKTTAPKQKMKVDGPPPKG